MTIPTKIIKVCFSFLGFIRTYEEIVQKSLTQEITSKVEVSAKDQQPHIINFE